MIFKHLLKPVRSENININHMDKSGHLKFLSEGTFTPKSQFSSSFTTMAKEQSQRYVELNVPSRC